MMSPEQQAVDSISPDVLRDVLKFLDDDEVDAFRNYLEYRQWPADSMVMQAGEPGDFMGFLVAGSLMVRKESNFPGKHILMAILDPGSMVGEATVAERCARNATVVAQEDAQLLLLKHESMERLIVDHPDLAIKVLQRIIQVIGRRFKVSSDRLAKLL
ncbi:Crp/Fnr family transcriptional regulator [Thermodesulfobacteriota bacterium]